MSAAGQFVPPLLIFPRKNKKSEFGDGAPAGGLIKYNLSGWITTMLFTQWFQHFIAFVHPTAEDPVILIFDGHFSHTRNLDIISLARKHHVILICLPPHCSDKIQPLDVAFMKPLKSYYSREIDTWMANNPGRKVTHFQVGSLFRAAYEQAATMSVARHGFEATGILPFNPDIFPDWKFITAADKNPVPRTPVSSVPARAGTSGTPSSGSTRVSPYDITPIPTVPAAPPSNRRGSAKIITESPHKNELIRCQQRKEEKEKKQAEKKKRLPAARKLTLPAKPTTSKPTKARGSGKPVTTSKAQTSKPRAPLKQPAQGRKRKVSSSSSSSSSSSHADVEYASSVELDFSSSSESQDEENDANCQFCGVNFSADKHGEKWIQCSKCWSWSHETCDAAVDECRSKKKYICSSCLND